LFLLIDLVDKGICFNNKQTNNKLEYMGRIHALEWEDLSWFPADWRDYGTNYLNFLAVKADIYKAVVPLIKKGIEAGNGQDWIDSASGGGGGILKLAGHLKTEIPNLNVTLTDYYPNIKAFERLKEEGGDLISYENLKVNAMEMPLHLQGKFRSLFGAFHHFRPEEGKKILQNAVDTRSPIAIFEPLNRNFLSFFSMLFVIPNVLLLTPFIRPFNWKVLPFIYLLPLIPLYVLWDGIASIFRMYSKKELESLVGNLENKDNFEWEIGKTKGPMSVYYLLGIPKK
jgi:hypothetical protein